MIDIYKEYRIKYKNIKQRFKKVSVDRALNCAAGHLASENRREELSALIKGPDRDYSLGSWLLSNMLPKWYDDAVFTFMHIAWFVAAKVLGNQSETAKQFIDRAVELYTIMDLENNVIVDTKLFLKAVVEHIINDSAIWELVEGQK